MTGGSIEGGELHFSVDSEHALIIDRTGLRGELPPLQGAVVADDFTAVVMRKFFTVNCAQAVAAYLGYRENCQYIHEAVNHPRVGSVVIAALAEAAAALEAEFPHQKADIERDAAQALERLATGDTADTISRVAREPRRKLSPRERLVWPARLAQRHGLRNEALTRAIAAALAYDAPTDAQAVSLQQSIAAEGLDKVLTEDCGLLPHEPLARAVRGQWRVLMAQNAGDGATLTATGMQPTSAALRDVIQAMVSDLSRQYDPTLVREALAQVLQERCTPCVPVFAASELERHVPAVAA